MEAYKIVTEDLKSICEDTEFSVTYKLNEYVKSNDKRVGLLVFDTLDNIKKYLPHLHLSFKIFKCECEVPKKLHNRFKIHPGDKHFVNKENDFVSFYNKKICFKIKKFLKENPQLNEDDFDEKSVQDEIYNQYYNKKDINMLYEKDGEWPEGTLSFKKVKLLEEIKI